MRHLNNNGMNFLKGFESFVPHIYLCQSGVETIGYGETNKKVINDFRSKIMTEDYASKLLKNSLVKYQKCVEQYVKVPLSENEYAALVCFCYNVGRYQFRSSTLLKVLNRKDYEGVPNQFMRWIYSRGKKSNGLIKRRNCVSLIWNLYDGVEVSFKH